MVKVANIVFNPFTNDSRVEKTSKSLSNMGYHVEVIANLDDNLPKKEFKDNFTVVRFSYLNRKITKGKIKKIKAYIKFIQESVNYVKNFDILHCNDLNTLPIAFIVKRFLNKNIKVVYDAHEYESEMKDMSNFSKKATKFFENILIKYADKILTVSNSIANEYAKLYNIQKPDLILNTPPYQDIIKKDLFRKEFNISKTQKIFLFQGALTSGRGIELMIEAFESLDDSMVAIFMGYGPLSDLIIDYSKKNSNIFYHEAVPSDILLDYTSSADFGILFYENNCLNHYYCSPNKLFEYIMAEIAIISSNLYELKRIIENNKIGVVAKSDTPDGLKEAIKKAMKLNSDELNKNLKKAKEKYNWQEQEKILLKVYKELK